MKKIVKNIAIVVFDIVLMVILLDVFFTFIKPIIEAW